MKKTVLKDLGFTEGEIKVYYALFELGESTVGPISKTSGVTHAKVYPILEKLIKKGLVGHVIKKGRKHFSTTHPNSLLEFVNKKVRSLENEKERITELIPELLAKKQAHEKTQYSRIFEGMGGLRSLFYELFNENKERTKICVLGLNEILKQPKFINFFLFYHDLRIKNKIELKLILNKNMKKFFEKKYSPTGTYKANQVKFVDTIYPTGVFIFKDHVINIMADDKVTAFDNKSDQMADRYRKFFYSLWNKN